MGLPPGGPGAREMMRIVLRRRAGQRYGRRAAGPNENLRRAPSPCAFGRIETGLRAPHAQPRSLCASITMGEEAAQAGGALGDDSATTEAGSDRPASGLTAVWLWRQESGQRKPCPTSDKWALKSWHPAVKGEAGMAARRDIDAGGTRSTGEGRQRPPRQPHNVVLGATPLRS